jgi:hypothetical protein
MLVCPSAILVGLFYGGDMGKYDKIKVGEKLPGTYCPVCQEIGLRKMVFNRVEWAICPMDSAGNPTVKKLKDAHTGWKLQADDAEPVEAAVLTPFVVPTPEPEENNEEEGVDDA